MTEEDNCEEDNEKYTYRSKKVLSKDEILMRHYEQLRMEVRKLNELLQKQVIRIIAVLGLLIAYADLSTQSAPKTFILAMPFAIVILCLMFVWALYWSTNLLEHIVTIQEEIPVEKFSFELDKGYGSKEMDKTEFVVIVSLLVIVISIYVTSIIFSWKIIEPPVSLYGVTLGKWLFYVLYAALTIIFGFTAGTFIWETKPFS